MRMTVEGRSFEVIARSIGNRCDRLGWFVPSLNSRNRKIGVLSVSLRGGGPDQGGAEGAPRSPTAVKPGSSLSAGNSREAIAWDF